MAENVLSNLSLQDNDEFLSKYFTADLPAEETFHVIVEPPASTATSNEVLKLREVALLKEKLSKSEYVRNEGLQVDLCKMIRLFVTNKSFKFTVLIEMLSKPLNNGPFRNDKAKDVVKHLMAELNLRKKTTN
ncbi:unnamed protein product [Rhizophagus irregularis]|nr:unnamed protein product [Rhizophagus irregularis]